MMKLDIKKQQKSILHRSSTPLHKSTSGAMNGAPTTGTAATPPTRVEELSSSPQSFHLRSSNYGFSKDYSYSPDNRDSRRTSSSPRTLGHSYERFESARESRTSLKETSKTSATTLDSTPPTKRADGSPLHLDVLSSSPKRPQTFSYKQQSSEEIKIPGSGVSPIISPFDRSPLAAQRTNLRGPLSSTSDIKEPTPSPRGYQSSSLNRSEELAKARRQFLESPHTPSTLDRTSATPSRTSLGAISSTSSPRIASSLASRSYSSPKIAQKDTPSVPMSGRMSRQSRESALDSSSSSSVSSEEGSMVDEYEKDDSRQDAATLAGSAMKPSATLPSRLTTYTATTTASPSPSPFSIFTPAVSTSAFSSSALKSTASNAATRSAYFSSEKPPTAPKPKGLASLLGPTPYSSSATATTSTHLYGSSRLASTATTTGSTFTTSTTSTSGISPTGTRPWVGLRDNFYKRPSPSTDATGLTSVTTSPSFSPSLYTSTPTYTPGSLFAPPSVSSASRSKSPTSTSGIGSSLSTATGPSQAANVPRFTHMSRKRIVTNADGSVEETEEVLEPSKLASASSALPSTTSPKLTPFYPSSSAPLTSPSKPIVVGVVPNTSFTSSIIDTAQANSTLDTATSDTASAYFSSVRVYNF